MSYRVLARQWRPRSFDQLVGQHHVARALANALEQQQLHHAYLFAGTHGVGKTTVARIFAKALSCEQGVSATPCQVCHHCKEIDDGRFIDLIEVDAASRTKVEDTRELLDNVQYAPTKGRFKIYLIDEVHMLSNHSFNALLKTLEEPPEHVKFLLATTDPQKLPATVLSRCLQFKLKAMTQEQINHHLTTILQQEKIAFENAALPLLSQAANGSMRDALSLMDQAIAYCNNDVTVKDIEQLLGIIAPEHLAALLRALANQSGEDLLIQINHMAEQGADFFQVTSQLLSLLQHIAIVQAVPGTAEILSADTQLLIELAQCFSEEDIQLYYQIALIGSRDLHLSPSAKAGFEMMCLRMLTFMPNQSITDKPLSKPKPVAQSQPTQIKKSSPGILTKQNWPEVLESLAIAGPTKAVASHCTVTSFNGNKITMSLASNHQAMMNKKQQERIESAIKEYLGGQPITLEIIISEQQLASTPAAIAQTSEENKQAAAKQSIEKDYQIQSLMHSFDAKVIATSPIESDD